MDPQGKRPDTESQGEKEPPSTPQDAIRKNLSSFLNPGLGVPVGAKPMDPKRAMQLHMAQMELANRLRMPTPPQNETKEQSLERPESVGDNPPVPKPPVPPSPPAVGFGGGPQAFQMSRPNFGQKPTASRVSPYQRILANANNPVPEPSKREERENGQEQILAVPEDAEVRVNESQKRLRGKKFRNPSL